MKAKNNSNNNKKESKENKSNSNPNKNNSNNKVKLNVNNVKKYFGGIKALDGVSFEIKEGAITAIIGPNGSGKSTMFNVISNIMRKDEGDVYFDGKNVSKMYDYQRARLGIARTFQEVRLFKNLTIRDHINIALSESDEMLHYSTYIGFENRDEEIKDILRMVGLTKSLGTYATDLSYGQRKLLDLAVAIAKPHTLLMLDEPVAGVNPKLREEIKKILRSLNEDGETILLIEHDMNFVMDLANHVIVMDEGKVLVQGSPKKIQNDKRVLDAYLGEWNWEVEKIRINKK